MLDFCISASLENDCHIKDDDRILVGVSGGIDSIYLLTQLYQTGQPIVAAVFCHGLRPEAAEECDFVQSYCDERGISCVRGEGDVRTYAKKNRLGIEEAARDLRYRFLFQTAAENNCAAVATAHHANDQAETVLMHILRGTGIDGLVGMRPYGFLKQYSETIPLIRPLLDITREDIESFASETGMPYREDRSNSDPNYTRNRIRHELLPQLAAEYNPRIVDSLCRLGKAAAADKEILDGDCQDALRYASFYKFDTCCEWSRKTYCSYLPGLRQRLLRWMFAEMGADLSKIGWERIMLADYIFMSARRNQVLPFIDGYWLCCEGEKALILTEPTREQWKYPQAAQGWGLYIETRHISEKDLPLWIEKARTHPEIAVLDANQIAGTPSLRTIRPGDRFEPYGLGGKSQKMSDFLINNKVPAQYRCGLVIAADSAGIIWVPGHRVSNRCALRDDTRKIVILKLKNTMSHGDRSLDS
ncbi:MAG: tRNA lysidine(34) synthetase TilS [Anaerolineaceae bacterium]|nr:tRNA lysidine(34) synthetase TilS [Anaerolineaceae bacterium]